MNAEAVMIKHWDGKFPVNPSLLASRLGIEVVASSGVSYAGKAAKSADKIVININSDESTLRQRFALAHAIGHCVLGHLTSEIVDTAAAYDRRASGRIEREANEFAMELLIPKLALDHFIFKKGVTNPVDLAHMFSVSQVCMHSRLKKAGYLQ